MSYIEYRQQTEPPTKGVFDPSRLLRLMSLAGPGGASELVSQLQTDLHEMERGLSLEITGPDWTGLRREAHRLIAVAGTIGADTLYRNADCCTRLPLRKTRKACGTCIAPSCRRLPSSFTA